MQHIQAAIASATR